MQFEKKASVPEVGLNQIFKTHHHATFLLYFLYLEKELYFYNNKKQFKMKEIDINKILISKPESYGTKNAKKKKKTLDIAITLLDQYAYFSLK